MMSNDLINGLFELGGAVAILLSVRAIIKDKCYAGVSPLNLVFFTTWSTWNLYYYPALNQTWSFLGGCAITLANATYLFCLWWFPHHHPDKFVTQEEHETKSSSSGLSLEVGKKYRNGFGEIVTILEPPKHLLPGTYQGSNLYTYYPWGLVMALTNYDRRNDLVQEVVGG